MTRILWLLLRILSNPVANFYQKKLSSVESSITVNFYTSLFMGFVGVFGLFNVNFKPLDLNFFLLVLSSGVLCFLGTLCLIKALKCGEMSVLGPLNSYKSIIGLIGAFILLGETPKPRGLIGFFLIIGASFLLLTKGGKLKLSLSVFLRFFALLFTGIEAVILKKIILLTDPFTCFTFWCLSSAFVSIIFGILTKKVKKVSFDFLKVCFYIAFLTSVMQFSTNKVFKSFEVGPALSLFQLSNLVSLFLGYKFYKEKDILRKSIGAFIMIIGSALILI